MNAMTRFNPAGLRGAARLMLDTMAGLALLTQRAGTDKRFKRLSTTSGSIRTPRSLRRREALLAALNGVLGDHLLAIGNPLAIAMRLRHRGQPLTLDASALAATIPAPSGKLLVLVHGLCMNDLQWSAPAHHDQQHFSAASSPPAANADCHYADLGYQPVCLHYNSGRHISTNGREFSALMDALIQNWPVPVEELVIIASSMGGLVTRSACHYGDIAGHRWRHYLRKLVFLGTPHHGAPLERGGNWVDTTLGASRITAPLARLGKIRSAGITDLRYGNLLDEDWQGYDRFERGDHRRTVPLPAGVQCFAIAATTGHRSGDLGDRLLGDGLVPVDSALGRHREPARNLAIPLTRQWIGYGINHLEMLTQPAVQDQVRRWLVPTATRQTLCGDFAEPLQDDLHMHADLTTVALEDKKPDHKRGDSTVGMFTVRNNGEIR